MLLTGEEGLCEVEARHPESLRSTLVNPVAEELQPAAQISKTRNA